MIDNIFSVLEYISEENIYTKKKIYKEEYLMNFIFYNHLFHNNSSHVTHVIHIYEYSK